MNKPSVKIPEDLTKLLQKIAELPPNYRDQLLPLASRLLQYIKARNRLKQIAQEKITQLEMNIKWLEFDLWATGQERDEAKKTLKAILRRRHGLE